MKKIVTLIALLLIGSPIYSLPISNPVDPLFHTTGLFWDDYYIDCNNECYDPYYPCNFHWDYSIRLGYYGDFVYDRKIKRSGVEGGFIDDTQLWTNAAVIVLNIWDLIDLYGMAGGTNAQIETLAYDIGVSSLGRIEIDTQTDFSYGLGAKTATWLWDCIVIGLDARYFAAHPNVRRITLDDIISIYPDDHLEFKYQEWKVSFSIAYPFDRFVPYFGVKWNKFHGHFNGYGSLLFEKDIVEFGFKNRRNWGYAFGLSLFDTSAMSLNVEARFYDESSLSVIGQFRI